MQTFALVQLPFPSLDYFPHPRYFKALETWHRSAISRECTVPIEGIWELPPWITWLKAAISATVSTEFSDGISVIDLSRVPFDFDQVMAEIEIHPEAEIYAFSPLTQNISLTTRVADELRKRGRTAIAGGAVAANLDTSKFDSIFLGRIEANFREFSIWLTQLLDGRRSIRELDINSFITELDYSWAPHFYRDETIYMRTFSHHGCPLRCSFCADRRSGSLDLPPSLIQSDIERLLAYFDQRTALYIGDLTFGISSGSVANLIEVIRNVKQRLGRELRLIVQTAANMISPSLVNNLRDLGVVLVEIGVESASVESVRRTEKGRPSTRWLEDKFGILLDSGFHVAGNVIVGLPHDDHLDYEQTESFIAKWRDTVWFNIYGFVPYPTTPLYRELVRDGRVKNSNWDQWCEGAPFVFEPYTMSSSTAYGWLRRILSAALD